MKVSIKKTEYAQGLLPWCPYVNGFWLGLLNGYTSLFWAGYRIDFKRASQ